MSIALQVALVMVTILVILLIIGAPIGVAIGLSSAVSMICMIPANVSFATSAQRIFAGSNSFSLIAIPFFILAGNIMAVSQQDLLIVPRLLLVECQEHLHSQM